jgi:ribosome-binding factor A
MSELRNRKLESQIQEEISSLILLRKIKDPRVSPFLSISRIELSGDSSYAKVFVSSIESDERLDSAVKGLTSAAGFIQGCLGKKLHIRSVPHLVFAADTAVKEGCEVTNKIKDLMD